MPVKKAQEYIENNPDKKFSVDELADMLALGRRSLERRFKQATGNAINEYIQRVKVEVAKKDFERSHKNINQVMFDVGYTDAKGFRTVFKKITGLRLLSIATNTIKRSSDKLGLGNGLLRNLRHQQITAKGLKIMKQRRIARYSHLNADGFTISDAHDGCQKDGDHNRP